MIFKYNKRFRFAPLFIKGPARALKTAETCKPKTTKTEMISLLS